MLWDDVKTAFFYGNGTNNDTNKILIFERMCCAIMKFDQAYEEWMQSMIQQEMNHRRREILEKGLGHGTVEFLRSVWFPTVRNFNHLYPEWEVRDFHNGYRYLDLAYIPGGG
jgi:hypothetical protein